MHDLRQPRCVVDLRCPLGQPAEHLGVVQLLEGFTADLFGTDLPDEKDHRSGVLPGGVHTDACVRRTRAAGDEADAGPIRQLPVGLRHGRGPALLTSHKETDTVRGVVHGVDRGQVALAGHAEHGVDTVKQELIDEHLPARARCRRGREG
jgi:hypothetical protein